MPAGDGAHSEDASGIEVVFIHRHPPCKKCIKTRAAIEEAVERSGERVVLKEAIAGTPEADAYGVVVSPMVLVDGKTVSAGFPPLVSTLSGLLTKFANSCQKGT